MSIMSCGLGHDEVQRALYAPREAEIILGVSHATLYKLISEGRLEALKLGGATRITAASIKELIASLPKLPSLRATSESPEAA
jgi:excisionase family DNA binding protein